MTIAEVKRALLRVEDEVLAADLHSSQVGLIADESVQELNYQVDYHGFAVKTLLTAVRGLVEIVEE